MPKDTFRKDSSTGDDGAISSIVFREPETEDGASIFELVRACKPLDENSRYCNLIQADHFRETCVVAELDGGIVGWVSGHMIPSEAAVFVWQVAVSPQARGMGLGGRMLRHLIARETCLSATLMKTTITEDNAASWAMFEKFAASIGGELTDTTPHFEADVHFDGEAATEHMVSITVPRAKAPGRRVEE